VFMARGFDGFISKPIDMRQLSAAIKKYVRDAHSPEVVGAGEAVIDRKLAQFFVQDALKAIAAMERVLAGQGQYTQEEARLFTINAHAMKSALLHVGQGELSAAAARLELAGREGNGEIIAADTPEFLRKLRAVVAGLAARVGDGAMRGGDGTARDGDDGARDGKDGAMGGDVAGWGGDSASRGGDGAATEGVVSGEELEYLRGGLAALREACEAYDKKTAKELIAQLRERTWPEAVREALARMDTGLLCGDFAEVGQAAEGLAGVTSP